jgi:hypothetical protein
VGAAATKAMAGRRAHARPLRRVQRRSVSRGRTAGAADGRDDPRELPAAGALRAAVTCCPQRRIASGGSVFAHRISVNVGCNRLRLRDRHGDQSGSGARCGHSPSRVRSRPRPTEPRSGSEPRGHRQGVRIRRSALAPLESPARHLQATRHAVFVEHPDCVSEAGRARLVR